MESTFWIDFSTILLRLVHVLAAIMWVGLGFWLNFVNNPTQLVLDLPTRQKIAPQLMPRTMYWFKWAGLYTYFSGLAMVIILYYLGGLMFEADGQWGLPSLVMLAVAYLSWFVYDWLYSGPLKKNDYLATVVMLVLLGGVLYGFEGWAGWSYRAYSIHVGVLFGTIMILNFYFRLQPAQQKAAGALMSGAPPDPQVMGLLTMRARHNIYMSIPVVWTMLNAHSTTVGSGSRYFLWGVIIVGWAAADWLFKKAPTIKGM